MYSRIGKYIQEQKYGISNYIDTTNIVQIYDTSSNGFVPCFKVIKNPNVNNWVRLKFNNGRTLTCTLDHPLPVMNEYGEFVRTYVQDMKIGDKVPVSYQNRNTMAFQYMFNPHIAWLLGLIICDANYSSSICISLGVGEEDIIERVKYVVENELCMNLYVHVKDMRLDQNRPQNYYQVSLRGKDMPKLRNMLFEMYEGNTKVERHIPSCVFDWDFNARASFLAGMYDADGYTNTTKFGMWLGSTNKELAIQQMYLVESLGTGAKLYINHYNSKYPDRVRYQICFNLNGTLYNYMASEKKKKLLNSELHTPNMIFPSTAELVDIEKVYIDDYSYDVETASDHFDVSGIISHNCRTRVLGNTYDPENEVSHGRGNLSFTSINLPRLAIESKGSVESFYRLLEQYMIVVKSQLLERFEIQAKRHVYNFPFLMGQGVWTKSDSLKWDDEVREVIKHGSLSIGFVGLAEAMVSLYGHHHAEGEEYQKKALEIISYMRKMTDKMSEETGLNFTLLATPAESLAGRFLKLDRKKFGIIEGVTDKDFYTNSFHVPVQYKISAYEKIHIEAPYHALTNAGHISYIELDGDPTQNVGVIKKIVRCMHDEGIGYGSINHPVDRDPVCGFTGIIDNECPCCGRKESEDNIPFERIRRITGYLVGDLSRWNNAKRAEEAMRVKHGIHPIIEISKK